MNLRDPINWKISFQREDKIYVSDKAILLDNDIAFINPLPPDGTDKRSEDERRQNYVQFEELWSRPAFNRFSFGDLSVLEDGNFGGPDKIILNKKYISFLLRRIPEELLRFGMTGKEDAPVWLYRDEVLAGLLMPIYNLPDFGPELVAIAEKGNVVAQVRLGMHYGAQIFSQPHAKEAVKWFSKAAEQGDPEAMTSLAFFFSIGAGVPKDNAKSLMLIEKAIELGHLNALTWRKLLIQNMPPEEYRIIAAQIATQMEKQVEEQKTV